MATKRKPGLRVWAWRYDTEDGQYVSISTAPFNEREDPDFQSDLILSFASVEGLFHGLEKERPTRYRLTARRE